jgi:hypothetical protein
MAESDHQLKYHKEQRSVGRKQGFPDRTGVVGFRAPRQHLFDYA